MLHCSDSIQYTNKWARIHKSRQSPNVASMGIQQPQQNTSTKRQAAIPFHHSQMSMVRITCTWYSIFSMEITHPFRKWALDRLGQLWYAFVGGWIRSVVLKLQSSKQIRKTDGQGGVQLWALLWFIETCAFCPLSIFSKHMSLHDLYPSVSICVAMWICFAVTSLSFKCKFRDSLWTQMLAGRTMSNHKVDCLFITWIAKDLMTASVFSESPAPFSRGASVSQTANW